MLCRTPSVFAGPDPTNALLTSVQEELEDKVIPRVAGLHPKYFEDQTWSTFVQDRLRHRKAVKVLNKLTPNLAALDGFKTLTYWLADFQNLFFQPTQDDFQWHTHQLPRKNGCLRTGVSLEASNVACVTGSTRAFGIVYHTYGRFLADNDDDTVLFFARARQIFASQPARCFVHGFTILGPMLQLWVFDRSGVYSSGKFNLLLRPDLLIHVLAGYTLMSDDEAGMNTFVKRWSSGVDSHVVFKDVGIVSLRPILIARADYIVGAGTTCFAASYHSQRPDSGVVVKFAWRGAEDFTEVRIMEKARERGVRGTVKLITHEDLTSVAKLREGLYLEGFFDNQVFSCIVTTPLGRPLRLFSSISEFLEVLRDVVRALQSLYLDGGIVHRDVAIKNIIIAPQQTRDDPKGVLIDFDHALDVDDPNYVHVLVGSDGLFAIGPLFGDKQTYRHDLEALFYVFLWMAISNDRVHDEAEEILPGLPATSRLRKWVTMDFPQMGMDKLADMEPKGFEKILEEFCSEFAHLKGLARELRALIFPIRDGKIFIDTDTDKVAVQNLYDGMANAFDAQVRASRK